MALSTLKENLIAVIVVSLAIVFIMIFILYVPRWAYFKIKNHPRVLQRAREREERRLEMEKIDFDEDLEKAEERNSWRMKRPMPAFVAPRDGYGRGRF